MNILESGEHKADILVQQRRQRVDILIKRAALRIVLRGFSDDRKAFRPQLRNELTQSAVRHIRFQRGNLRLLRGNLLFKLRRLAASRFSLRQLLLQIGKLFLRGSQRGRLLGLQSGYFIVKGGNLFLQLLGSGQIVIVQSGHILGLQRLLVGEKLVEFAAARRKLQLAKLIGEEFDMAVHRPLHAFGKIVVRNKTVVFLGLFKPLVDKFFSVAVGEPQNHGSDVRFQLIAVGVYRAGVGADQIIQQGRGRIRSGRRNVLRAHACPQTVLIDLCGARQNRVVEKSKLALLIGHNTRGDIRQMQQSLHVGIAGRKASRCRVGNQLL